MSTITVTASSVAPGKPAKRLPMVEATTDQDGFTVTMLALRKMKVDTRKIPMGLARILYNAGVAFARLDKTTEEERMRTRNLMIWPVTDK